MLKKMQHKFLPKMWMTGQQSRVVDHKSYSQRFILPSFMAFSVTFIAMVMPTTTFAADKATPALYADSCAACHDTGALNAPKTGDKATWQRLEAQKGMAGLVSSVKNGMPQMPAGGLCGTCTDEQYRQLIEYMRDTKK